MKKIIVGILIVCLYCFPFVYNSMYQDFANRSMLGYLLMLMATLLLAFLGKLFSSSIYLIIGNIISVIISFYFINEMSWNEEWGGYFKPLTPNQLLIFASVLFLVPQLFAMRLAKKLKDRDRVKG
ncbi:hypothetical protein [Terribacillus saccharophilus]|uniref:Uncharacterized protein n=1 Tax=Terribacillus saccharophilus TaxID=361277 RepID=A0ABX4GX10_9BACI|nr:hypothetical protein [Terribacillus saccharophilus]PAD95652.1 hypothetical protein CHH50_12355 [Terribacillus saccharophilus]PAD99422.1 hypothetical protein CHH48_13250 [Terribacillus saccharophilus]